jgi:hypothetical protein
MSELKKWFENGFKISKYTVFYENLGYFRLRQWFNDCDKNMNITDRIVILKNIAYDSRHDRLDSSKYRTTIEEAIIFLGERQCKKLLVKWCKEHERNKMDSNK